MHDPYLYSYLPRTLRVWSILPAQLACTPSLECFKSRIVTAFATGTIVIVPLKSLGRSTGAATGGQLLYVCLASHVFILTINNNYTKKYKK